MAVSTKGLITNPGRSMKPIGLGVLSALFCLLVAGCSNTTTLQPPHTAETQAPEIPKLQLESDRFFNRPAIETPDDLFTLSPAQQREFAHFRAAYIEELKQKTASKNESAQQASIKADSPLLVKDHEIIGAFLKKISARFSYRGATLTAQEALLELSGNCMSLAILTAALAKQQDVEIHYQLVTDSPVYQKQNNVIIRGQHVRSKLFDPTYKPKPGHFAIIKPSIIVDYFPALFSKAGRRVSNEEFLAMYYNNIAAEHYIHNRIEHAYWYTREALKHHRANAQSLNLLALVFKSLGEYEKTVAIFEYGRRYSEQKLELLSNYQQFLLQRGELAKANEVEQQLLQLDRPNPFDWLNIAEEALNKQQLYRAERYFMKAQKLAPYLHQPYAGLAKIKYLHGQRKESKALFEKALKSTYRNDIKSQYREKLNALTYKPPH